MTIIDFLASNTVATVTKFLIDQVTEYRKRTKSKNKEVEELQNKLDGYKDQSILLEKELSIYKETVKRLEMILGGGYVSENAFVNWRLDTIKPEKPSFKINVWTEKGDFHGAKDITIIPKTGNYRVGDKINIYFRTEKDCYLTLINYGTSGKLTVLFPNSFSEDNFISASRIYAVPGEDYRFIYVLSGPPGTERIKAVATERKISLFDLAYGKGEVFSTSTAAAKDISIVANKIESAAPEEWAEAECWVEVI